MTKRIFFTNFFSVFCAVLLSSFLVTWVCYNQFLKTEVEDMFLQINIVGRAVEMNGLDFLQLSETSFRLTWISSLGEVLYDSHGVVDNMENHLDRQEVQEAISTGSGTGTRQSETLLTELVYVAICLEDGSILRGANKQSNLLAFFMSILQSLSLVIFFGAVLSFWFASMLSKKIMKPLAELNLEKPLENTKVYEEITPLLSQIQRQYQKIDLQLIEMSKKQEEFEIITRNMGEGLLLLDGDGHILSINDAASRLFMTEQQDSLGRNIFTLHRSVEMQQIMERAFSGYNAEGSIALEKQVYQVNASPIMTENQLSGLAVLFVNATEKSESEKIRREFTANVSHELKTPLHSISGCAELMSHNLVEQKDIPAFSSQIYTEAQRLIRLVEEIISLSRLDEGAEPLVEEEVDLASIAKEVGANLKELAQENSVTLQFQGKSGIMRGSYTLLSAVVRNLCENAMKYNRPEGWVKIVVEDHAQFVRLQVNDNGIGVSEEEKQLIFQRFYRVDKSRSKEIGGTGLGLSIVKHAVGLHQGVLSIESTPEVGTSIQIDFPKQKTG